MQNLTTLFLFPVLLSTGACFDKHPDTTHSTADQSGIRQKRPLSSLAPARRANYYKTSPEVSINETRSYEAIIVTADGNIVVLLNPFYAPAHVNNFVFLARQGFYDGLNFHRVEAGKIIQGGDPLGTGKGGPGYTLLPEIGLPHTRVAFAAARLPDTVNPELLSSGSQFYITQQAQHQLDGNYTVYGEVISGFEVLLKQKPGSRIIRIDIDESDG